ncbi:MAG: hypothetical protein ACP5M9_00260 [Candidatus Micrarchaeia archaeon]
MEGIVSTIKILGNSLKCNVLSVDEGKLTLSEAITKQQIKIGEKISLSSTLDVKFLGTANNKELNQIDKILSTLIQEYIKKTPPIFDLEDLNTATKKLFPKIMEAAKLFAKKLLLGAPIIIRFHNDADGSSGAYAISLSINSLISDFSIQSKPNITWLMQRSVVYEISDAIYDQNLFNYFSSTEKPLLLITDFGTSSQSNRGIERISESFDIIWLDHHPIEDDFNYKKLKHYINPWNFNLGSDITAGFLSCIFGYALSGKLNEEIINASFIGDYSKYADVKKLGNDLSIFLDMATSDPSALGSHNPKNITPSEIEGIISDKEKYNSFLKVAKMKLDETLERAKSSIKTYKLKNLNIYVCDFSSIRDKNSKYPLPGRFSSKLLDVLSEKDKNSILILHFGVYISMRMDKELSKDIDLLSIISELKDNIDDVESGGGHASACSLKLYEYADKKAYINTIINKIKEKEK